MISTQNLASLPNIPALRRLTQSMAMLDAIIEPEWQYRYYSFNSRWSEGEMMASMRNGSGDDWFLVFSDAGAILKGFARESDMNEEGMAARVLVDVPAEFGDFLSEPAFSMEWTTFCIWRTASDEAWRKGAFEYPSGPDPDGSAKLLSILGGDPRTYQDWAEGYYEASVDLAAVEHVYLHRPLTAEIVSRLNTDVSLDALAKDMAEIGYPS